jgi:thiamine pyrophosphate-dependent acetolactate synthase large subunit-like protein
MIGAEAILRTLRAMGVERIFASPGSDWAPLWEALARPHAAGGIPEYVSVRHEETAIAMASAYSKASGKLPAVVLHTTVGTLHAAMALRIALHERVPMVVMAGESITYGEPPAPMVGRQWLRLLTDMGGPARLIEPCVKWSVALNASLLLPQTMQRACQLALNAPRGPVFVSVPTEYLMETMAAPLPEPTALPRPAAAHPAALDELANALAGARKPLIITEEAGRDPATVHSLVALAEALGAPVAEAWQPYYVNFPRDHPLYAGVVPDIEGLVKDADAVLLAETVVPWHPPSSLGKGIKVYAIGEDPLRSNLPFWGFRADLVVPGDLRSTLEGLLKRISKKTSAAKTIRQELKPATAGMHTAWVAHELNEVLPKGAVVVNETITHRLELLRRLARLEPGGFYESSFGGLGVGLGVALGVKYAQPSRTVVVAIGDGAFHYNPVVASFGASQELGLPFLVVLFDNAGYLSQKTDVKTYYPDGSAVRTGRFAGTAITPRPEYAKLAEAYGGYGEKVVEAGQVRAALQRGLQEVEKGRLALLHMVLE